MQLYTYTWRNIFNTIKTSRHSSLEKYTSHFIERVYCEREWETEQRLQHIDPPHNSSSYHSLSFPFSWAAQPGPLEGSQCWDMVLIRSSSLQLTRTSCAPSYIIVLRPLNPNPRQSRLSPDILDRCISYFDSLPGSEVNMQHKDETQSKYLNWREMGFFLVYLPYWLP